MKAVPLRLVLVLLIVCGALHVALQLQHMHDALPQAAPPKNLTRSENRTASMSGNKTGSRGHWNRRRGPWVRTLRTGGRDNDGWAHIRASASRLNTQRWRRNNETRGSGAAKTQERSGGSKALQETSKGQGNSFGRSAKRPNTEAQFWPRHDRSGEHKNKREADRWGTRQRPTSQSRGSPRRGSARRQPINLSTVEHRGRGDGWVAEGVRAGTARNPQPNATSDCAGRAASNEEPPLISVLTSTTSSRRTFWKNLLRNFQHQIYPNKELIILDDGGSFDQEFWGNVSDVRVRHIHRRGDLRVGRKHTEMAKVACGEFMAIFDDDDYYGPDYLRFMLSELVERNVSLIKLGSWPQFMGRWEGAELSGSMWYFDVSKTKASMGYGFTYFFSRAAGQAPVQIPQPDKFNWDGQWVGELKAAGYRVALTNTHPSLLVIKIQHGDNLSRPFSRSLKPLDAKASEVKALLDPTLPVKILPAQPSDKTSRRAPRRVYSAPPSR